MPPRPGETEIEMVQRHVRQGEGHVASQSEIVSRLSPDSDLTETARLFLAALEETLASHRAHLARLLRSDWDGHYRQSAHLPGPQARRLVVAASGSSFLGRRE